MRKTRHNKGFTMAEMLIVVAIIIILAGFGFVGISRYQRSLHQLEMDGIAKEIFIAAQNHLTMADSQGLLKTTDGETTDLAGTKEADDIYYFVVGDNGTYPVDGGKRVLDLMLPFASVDETVRLGGSYIIRYQFSAAKVLDVFYANKTGRFAYTFQGENYQDLITNFRNGKKQERLKYNDGKSVIGWYGGEIASELTRGEELKVPTIEVINAERLLVKVSNPNNDSTKYEKAGLRLVITGKTSGKSYPIDLIDNGGTIKVGSDKSTFTVVLDDVTSSVSNEHFYNRFCKNPSNNLLPGEDITVQVISYNNNQLTNIAYSSEVETNSLFASLSGDNSNTTANIANFRHLENLSNAISGFNPALNAGTTIGKAAQIADMDWNQFMSVISDIKAGEADFDKVQIHPITGTASNRGSYMPVSFTKNDNSTYSLDYDGQGHKIMNVKVDHDGPAGIFGTLTNSNISNVLVYNTDESTDPKISGSGPVGGLVGEMTGGTITQCAAAVYVNATSGDAGGLVGKTTGTVNISNSYVGGHTKDGQYQNSTEGKFNVIASGTTANAGGLVGNGDGTLNVNYCYSTASVSGKSSAGGLIGAISDGGAVKNSYATGLVDCSNEDTKGAFIGSGTLNASSKDNLYYSIINGDLKPVGDATSNEITPFDESVNSYNTFVQSENEASPYDSALQGRKYGLATISELTNSAVTAPEWMSKHYGDWPTPETSVVNVKDTAATP